MPYNERKMLQAAHDTRRGTAEIMDGPVLEKFDVHRLAQLLEQECRRARAQGLPKVSLHMDVDDALKLSHVLTRVRK